MEIIDFMETPSNLIEDANDYADLWGVPYEGPRENPRSLSSPKAEKFESGKNGHVGGVMASTDRVSYTIRWSRIKIFLGISNELEACLGSGGRSTRKS